MNRDETFYSAAQHDAAIYYYLFFYLALNLRRPGQDSRHYWIRIAKKFTTQQYSMGVDDQLTIY